MTSRVSIATLALMTLSMCGAAGDKGKPSSDGLAHFPLAQVADVELPGGATRFDYQDIDPSTGHLFIAHMNDASVLVLRLTDGRVEKVLANIPTPRGVAIGQNVGRIFITSSPARLVIIDKKTLSEIARVPTGTAPDGVAYDPKDPIGRPR
jgi:YVTN family beta-propeller protein